MVSKARVILVMMAFFILAIAVIGLLAKLGAGAIWFKTLPIGIVLVGGVVGQSLGWFNKKDNG